MTATDELRRLLDERGVEYTVIPEDMYGSREYIKIGGTEIRTNGRGEVAVFYLTPEQAVEATLGSDLKAENEKLRDAARLMWQRLRWADETMGCGVLDKRFERRLHELGVEV